MLPRLSSAPQPKEKPPPDVQMAALLSIHYKHFEINDAVNGLNRSRNTTAFLGVFQLSY
jgi:hypothetical protein